MSNLISKLPVKQPAYRLVGFIFSLLSCGIMRGMKRHVLVGFLLWSALMMSCGAVADRVLAGIPALAKGGQTFSFSVLVTPPASPGGKPTVSVISH